MDYFAHHTAEHALAMRSTPLAAVIIGAAIALILLALAIKRGQS